MRRRTRITSSTLAIQALENRTLLAGSIANGVLTMESTNGEDTMRIRVEGDNATVDENGDTYDLSAVDVKRVFVTRADASK